MNKWIEDEYEEIPCSRDGRDSVGVYSEELALGLRVLEVEDRGERLVIECENEGGYNRTFVDLFDLLRYLKENKPELLEEGLK